MIVLAKNYDKAIIYRPGEKQMFVVAKTKAQVGDRIESYDGGGNLYTNDLAFALMKLYGIPYAIEVVKDIIDEVDIEDYGYFKCEVCGEVKPIEERCERHFYKTDNVCVDCCYDCRKDEELDEIVDRLREEL